MPFEQDSSATDGIVPFRRDGFPQRGCQAPLSSEARAARVLVTGASGFLGREIARQFDEAGIAIRALARRWPTETPSPRRAVRCVGDVTDAAAMASAVAGTNIVIHCAGLAHQFGKTSTHADAFRQINVQGTATVMSAAAAAQVEHVILVSSVSVYGGGTKPTDESSACRPTEPYGVSKLQAEQAAREICGAAGIRLTILRMATIFGEGDPGNIGRLMQSIDRGRFVWLGAGSNRKSLIYRGDAARACLLAAQAPSPKSDGGAPRDTYNIALPSVTVARIVESLATGLGRPNPRWYIPAGLVRTVGGGLSVCMAGKGPIARVNRTITKWLSDDIYLGDRFGLDYDFRPEVSLEEGLWREVAWYRQSKAA